MSRDELTTAALAIDEHRTLLLDHLDMRVAWQMPTHRVPWAIAGWYREAVAWFEDALVEFGYAQLGPVMQVKHWSISAILRVPTDRGNVYFKAGADLPLFVNEPVLMDELAARFPAQIPRPIKIDPTRRWMLMEDFGPVIEDRSGAIIEEVMAEFARLQIASAATVDDLLALDIFDRRLNVLHDQIDELIAHPLTHAKVAPEPLSRLRGLVPMLKGLCHELAAFNIPQHWVTATYT